MDESKLLYIPKLWQRILKPETRYGISGCLHNASKITQQQYKMGSMTIPHGLTNLHYGTEGCLHHASKFAERYGMDSSNNTKRANTTTFWDRRMPI